MTIVSGDQGGAWVSKCHRLPLITTAEVDGYTYWLCPSCWAECGFMYRADEGALDLGIVRSS